LLIFCRRCPSAELPGERTPRDAAASTTSTNSTT
jgi:hypothetical protein